MSANKITTERFHYVNSSETQRPTNTLKGEKKKKTAVKPAPEKQFTCFTVISSISFWAATGITVDTIFTRSVITACMIYTVVDVCKKKIREP